MSTRPTNDGPPPELGPLLAREWLETDGLGGYAASTPPGCPTRRYHGLLVAPFPGTVERHVFLSRFDEVLEGAEGRADALSLVQYGEAWAPRGDRALEEFELAPAPAATYDLGDARLRREVRMVRGRHAVLVRYALEEAPGARTLELRPVLPFRRADHLTVENDTLDPNVTRSAGGFTCRPYEALPALSFTSSRRETPFATEAVWYRDVVFDADRRRGFDGREDEFSPGVVRVRLEPGEDLIVAAAIDGPVEDPRGAWEAEGARREEAAPKDADPIGLRLERAADSFLYRGPGDRPGVIAGFPWFLEWGRDTFLALPGLTLARGHLGECAEVLTGALPYLRDGLLPNIFGDTPESSHYGSADAALWFARAALLFDRAGGPRRLVERELVPAVESIAEAYLEGTDLGLEVDEAGMLLAGGPDLNPTWMDARTSKGPVTPRHGCPVEIAALWHSMLAWLEERGRTKAARTSWGARRRTARIAFQERFWLAKGEYLADVWRDGRRDLAVRPNMVLAAALEHAPITHAQRRGVARRAEAELLTPRGLRTLSPNDPSYTGRYSGGPEERDGAYHQGTVWPWLLGAYTETVLRAFRTGGRGIPRAQHAELVALWDGMADELDRAGLDHLSEVFDGDEPHTPGGTFAQAWNTAEWLRARRMLAEGRA